MAHAIICPLSVAMHRVFPLFPKADHALIAPARIDAMFHSTNTRTQPSCRLFTNDLTFDNIGTRPEYAAPFFSF
jgi:hypothetical protein